MILCTVFGLWCAATAPMVIPIEAKPEPRICQTFRQIDCDEWGNEEGLLAVCTNYQENRKCSSWIRTPAGDQEHERESAALPICPRNMTIGEILMSDLVCKIPANELELKQVGPTYAN